MEAGQPADEMALDRHRAVRADAAEDRPRPLAQAAQQGAGAPVDEALHQRLMQRVGQPILERPRAALPGLRIGEPVGAIGDIGERAHPGEARRQRVDVAVDPVETGELALHPILRQPPVALGQDARTSPPIRRVCSSCVVLRKSGVWQTSHRRIRLARSRQRRMTSSSIDKLAQRRLVLAFLRRVAVPASAAARRASASAPAATGNRAARCATPLPSPAGKRGLRPRRRRPGRCPAHRR